MFPPSRDPIDPMVLPIGGSPSSGSTLLAHLLSRHEGVLCLPETGLFAHGDLVRGGQDGGSRPGIDLSNRIPWLDTEAKTSQAIRLDRDRLRYLLASGRPAADIVKGIVETNDAVLIVEKTPENIFALGAHLKLHPANRGVATTRRASASIDSLIRRGFTEGQGCLVWFAHAYEAARLITREPQRIFLCRYEELVADPKATTNQLLRWAGYDPPSVDDAEVDNQYKIEFEFAARSLAGSAWSRAITDPIAPIGRGLEPGLRRTALLDVLAFETKHHGLLRIRDVERALMIGDPLMSSEPQPIGTATLELNSRLLACLAENYRPVLVKGEAR